MNQYGCCPNPAYDIVGAMYQPLTKPNTEEFGERQKYEQHTARVYKELCDYSFEDIRKGRDTEDNLEQN